MKKTKKLPVVHQGSRWELAYHELLKQSREQHDQDLEERVRLQAELNSLANVQLTYDNLVKRVHEAEQLGRELGRVSDRIVSVRLRIKQAAVEEVEEDE